MSQVIRGITNVLFFFSPSAQEAIATWHNNLVEQLNALIPSSDYIEDLVVIGEIIGVVGGASAKGNVPLGLTCDLYTGG
jgi:hypothetical protein